MKPTTKTLLALAGLAIASTAANAAVSMSTQSGGYVDDSGSILYAYNLGLGAQLNTVGDGAQTQITYSGVTFDNVAHSGNHVSSNLPAPKGIDISGLSDAANGYAGSPLATVVSYTSPGADHFSSGILGGGSGSDVDNIFLSSSYANGGGGTSSDLNIGGLDAGKEYQIQILLGDNRTQSWAAWSFDMQVDGASVGTFQWGKAHGTGIDYNTAVITGVTGVTDTTVSLVGTYGGFGGVVVSQIPEPSVALLGGLGFLGLLRRRRK